MAAETAEERRVSWNGGDIGDLHQYAEDLSAGVSSSLDQNQAQAAAAAGARNNKMTAHHQQDALAIAQNGGLATSEEDMDGDADDGMDDDMMDKISSSPSIEDGGCTRAWPPRVDSLRPSPAACNSPVPLEFFEDARSSSPYLDAPEYFPLQLAARRAD